MTRMLFTYELSSRYCQAVVLTCLMVVTSALTAAEPLTTPDLPDGTAEAERAIATFRVPAGMKVELFAAEPKLGNPVAICLDEQGRVLVAEEYRFNRGTEENRTRPFLLEDDLQIQTNDERLAMFQKWSAKFEGGMDWFTRYTDQVRMLEDKDGDGRADRSTVFAAGFNGALDGMAAGVIARDGKVYVTCIPHLWMLQDKDGDGVADERVSLQSGFGVNAGFLGHDLHGLVWGPDGKLYFSVGDRGFHLKTKEGKLLSGPRSGAVFRCLPDGSQLEVVARGLRNPQELAFDQYGNLFAADNNCDKGDHSRLVYIVEGGDSGWNMAYQSMPAPYLTGPWHAEKIWHLADAEQPAWIVPPVGKLGAGPSGFAYYPGVGLPERYRDHFFMCNYTGNGGIESFAVVPQGAGFEIVDAHDFFKPLQATDIDFGYDGKVYVSDFVKLEWNGGGGWGRIYTLHDTERIQQPSVKETTERFRAGFTKLTVAELAKLLRHADMRMRLRAQYELAKRGTATPIDLAALEALKSATQASNNVLCRLHGIWGLGQVAVQDAMVYASIAALLRDENEHVRGQAAKVLGDGGYQPAGAELTALLTDTNPRVQFLAAMALGKLQSTSSLEPIIALLRRNANRDPLLRHAGVMALLQFDDIEQVRKFSSDPDPAVRMAVLLVLRRRADPRIAEFLNDADPQLVTEAARAINDLPIEVAMPALASLVNRYQLTPQSVPQPLMRRIINANFRAGKREQADALVALVANERVDMPMRLEALAALKDWSQPGKRDRVTGFWRPTTARSPEVLQAAVQSGVTQMLTTASGDLQTQLTELIALVKIAIDDQTIAAWSSDPQRPIAARVAALRLLAARRTDSLPAAIEKALSDQDARMRAAGRQALASENVAQAVKSLREVLSSATAPAIEKQLAIETVAALGTSDADDMLAEQLQRLTAGKLPLELQLELADAARRRPDSKFGAAYLQWEAAQMKSDPSALLNMALRGGDPEQGRKLFEGHAVAQCIRCHRVQSTGGNAGPELSRIGGREAREHLLQSLLAPDAKIAPGYGSLLLVLDDGKTVAGTLKSEDASTLELQLPTGEVRRIDKSSVEDRSQPKSAMPSMAKALTPRELRDLVEFLSTLK